MVISLCRKAGSGSEGVCRAERRRAHPSKASCRSYLSRRPRICSACPPPRVRSSSCRLEGVCRPVVCRHQEGVDTKSRTCAREGWRRDCVWRRRPLRERGLQREDGPPRVLSDRRSGSVPGDPRALDAGPAGCDPGFGGTVGGRRRTTTRLEPIRLLPAPAKSARRRDRLPGQLSDGWPRVGIRGHARFAAGHRRPPCARVLGAPDRH